MSDVFKASSIAGVYWKMTSLQVRATFVWLRSVSSYFGVRFIAKDRVSVNPHLHGISPFSIQILNVSSYGVIKRALFLLGRDRHGGRDLEL